MAGSDAIKEATLSELVDMDLLIAEKQEEIIKLRHELATYLGDSVVYGYRCVTCRQLETTHPDNNVKHCKGKLISDAVLHDEMEVQVGVLRRAIGIAEAARSREGDVRAAMAAAEAAQREKEAAEHSLTVKEREMRELSDALQAFRVSYEQFDAAAGAIDWKATTLPVLVNLFTAGDALLPGGAARAGSTRPRVDTRVKLPGLSTSAELEKVLKAAAEREEARAKLSADAHRREMEELKDEMINLRASVEAAAAVSSTRRSSSAVRFDPSFDAASFTSPSSAAAAALSTTPPYSGFSPPSGGVSGDPSVVSHPPGLVELPGTVDFPVGGSVCGGNPNHSEIRATTKIININFKLGDSLEVFQKTEEAFMTYLKMHCGDWSLSSCVSLFSLRAPTFVETWRDMASIEGVFTSFEDWMEKFKVRIYPHVDVIAHQKFMKASQNQKQTFKEYWRDFSKWGKQAKLDPSSHLILFFGGVRDAVLRRKLEMAFRAGKDMLEIHEIALAYESMVALEAVRAKELEPKKQSAASNTKSAAAASAIDGDVSVQIAAVSTPSTSSKTKKERQRKQNYKQKADPAGTAVKKEMEAVRSLAESCDAKEARAANFTKNHGRLMQWGYPQMCRGCLSTSHDLDQHFFSFCAKINIRSCIFCNTPFIGNPGGRIPHPSSDCSEFPLGKDRFEAIRVSRHPKDKI